MKLVTILYTRGGGGGWTYIAAGPNMKGQIELNPTLDLSSNQRPGGKDFLF